MILLYNISYIRFYNILNIKDLQGMVLSVKNIGVIQKLPYSENDNTPESLWHLSDYGFMVIHIFTKEGREYYDLDKLWNEAKEIKFNK